MAIIEQIKAEIERRKMESIGFRNNEKREDWASFFNGEATALENLLSFISSLESEHLADARKTSPKGLEEAAREYGFEEYRRRCNGGEYGTSEDAFIAGAKWDREQMMKDAIEATLDNTAYPTRLWFNTYLSEYSNNDKVSVIIVKED